MKRELINLGVHVLFASIGLWPLLNGTGLFGGIELNYSYSLFQLCTLHNLFSGSMLMNRLNLNGFPSFIPIGYAFNPFVYLFTALLPPFTDLHWFVFTQVVAGGFFCSIFLRQLRISFAGSLMGSMAYLSGSWWLVMTPEWSVSLPLLPLLGLSILLAKTKFLQGLFYSTLLVGLIWLWLPAQEAIMILTGYSAAMVVITLTIEGIELQKKAVHHS